MSQKTAEKGDIGHRWEYVEPANWYGVSSLVRNERGEPIAQIPLAGWGLKSGRRIGAMLAAAPHLLTACEEVLAWYEDQIYDGKPDPACIGEVRAALKKARGG